jgi:hypothetical protein
MYSFQRDGIQISVGNGLQHGKNQAQRSRGGYLLTSAGIPSNDTAALTSGAHLSYFFQPINSHPFSTIHRMASTINQCNPSQTNSNNTHVNSQHAETQKGSTAQHHHNTVPFTEPQRSWAGLSLSATPAYFHSRVKTPLEPSVTTRCRCKFRATFSGP